MKKGTVQEKVVLPPSPPSPDWNPLLTIIVLFYLKIEHTGVVEGKLLQSLQKVWERLGS